MRARGQGKGGGAIAVAALAAALTVAAAALAAGIDRRAAESIAKRVASRRVERFGISYPPGAWRAACDRRRAGGWRCAVGTGGQCSGALTVTGSTVRARVFAVSVWCFE